jgi:O-antigen/teichoic acid export membrane protein
VLGWMQGSTQGQVTWLWAGALAATSVVDALGQLLRARGRIAADNGVQLVLAIGGTAAAIGAVAVGAGVVGGTAGQAVGALVALVLAVWFARQLREFSLVPCWRLTGQGSRIRAAVPWALGLFASRFFSSVDLIVLGHLSGPEEVAMMAVALKPVFGAMVIPNAVSAVVYPALARARGRARGRLAWRTVAWLAAAGLVVGTAIALVGRPLMILLFGPAYASAAQPLAPLAIGLTFLFPEWLLGQTLLAYGQARAYAIGWVATLVLITAGEFLVVPHFGAFGAACVKTAGSGGLLAWQIAALARTLRRDSPDGITQLQ